MSEPGPILAAGQAAIEAALAAVPAGAAGALVVVATPAKQTAAVVSRVGDRWLVGATLSHAAGKVDASVIVRGTW